MPVIILGIFLLERCRGDAPGLSKFHFDVHVFLEFVDVKYIWVLICACEIFKTGKLLLANISTYPGLI